MMRWAFVLALLAPLPAAAQRVAKIDGTKLMSLCGAADVKGCLAYMNGVADAMAEEPKPRRACIPPNVTAQQLRDVVMKLLRDEPEKRGYPAAKITVHAFAKAFPCGK